MTEIVPVKIRYRQFAEGIVEDGCRHLDRIIAGHNTLWFEPGECIGFDKFLKRHAILKANRHGDRKIIHQRAESRAFLVHVDEDFANTTILIFTSPQIDFVAADRCLLRVALTAVWQPLAFRADNAFHNLFDHLWCGCGNRCVQRIQTVLVLVNILDKAR